MTWPLDASHDPALVSWVDSANAPDTDFPLQNLPYGRFRRAGSDEPWRIGVAIGDQVLDLRLALELAPWSDADLQLLKPLAAGDLGGLMGSSLARRSAWRGALSAALGAGSDVEPWLQLCLLPQSAVELTLPCAVGGYTAFFGGLPHATAVSRLLRAEQPLTPNYKWVPLAQHGRASSLRASGEPVRRPNGQYRLDVPEPRFGPTRRLDYGLALGAVVGSGNRPGWPVRMADAERHLFGVLLLNDWSARDVQAWEQAPLGPFVAKGFQTTLSPWLVTMEALAPFRSPFARPAGEPPPLAYLDSAANRAGGQLDIALQAALQTASMRERGVPPCRLGQANFRDAWWTLAQMVAHHTVGGCDLRPGDVLGSGPQSGTGDAQGGSLLELTLGGRRPLILPGGEQRRFLEDGDSVVLRGHCTRDGFRRIGFGVCQASVLAAHDFEAPAG